MQIALTGNPFVDTGLGVIASLSGCENIDDLTKEQMHKVHGNGESLARWNSKLKSTNIVFGMNSLILRNQIKPEGKKILYYSKMTTALLNNIGLEDIQERCESCGNPNSLDINKLFTETLIPLGYSKGTRYIGRDWFPLAGSIGNDAQALPSASRAPNLCAKCLFAVHYLPLGVILVNGKLAVFQSTSKDFWYALVNTIATEVKERIYANNFTTIGSKEGSIAEVTRILNVMEELHGEDLEPETSVFVWTFSNSGNGPYCHIDEIPNSALIFLYKAVRYVQRNEIIEIILKDKKSPPQYSFINCISKGTDYRHLYPYKKFNGVSPKLFSLYQTLICGISANSLNTAFKIAKYISEKTTKKEFESIGKDIDVDIGKQNTVNKFIVQMVSEGLITFDEYAELFISKSSRIVKLNYSAWKFIKYYMHNLTSASHLDNINKEIRSTLPTEQRPTVIF
jgi:CRISPR-associated protein Cst1